MERQENGMKLAVQLVAAPRLVHAYQMKCMQLNKKIITYCLK